MKFVRALPLVLVASAGCSSMDMRPEKPLVLTPASSQGSPVPNNPLFPYTLPEFQQDYAKYKSQLGQAADQATKVAGDSHQQKDALKGIYGAATVSRDIMINRIRADIHANAGEFEDALRQRIAEWGTAADFGELGLSAATTIVGGEQSKTVLAAILTAVKGGHAAVSKNFFQEQTSKALVAVLRSSRMKMDLAIVSKMADTRADQYTFEEAWTNLVDLYYAGTLASGFQELTEQAGGKTNDAKAHQENADKSRSPTLRAALFEQPASIDGVALAQRIGKAMSKITEENVFKRIMNALGVSAEDGQSPRDALKTDLFKSLSDLKRMTEYQDALNAEFGKENW